MAARSITKVAYIRGYGKHSVAPGFSAVWLQWIQNVVWYPVVLGFTAATLGYLFCQPGLADNHVFNFAVVLVVYWIATFIALFGEKSYGSWSQWLSVLGTIIPGVSSHAAGRRLAVARQPARDDHRGNHWRTQRLAAGQQVHPWLPNITGLGAIAFLAGTVLLFAGVEVQGVRANLMQSPSREFPEATTSRCRDHLPFFTFWLPRGGDHHSDQAAWDLRRASCRLHQASLDLFHVGWLVPVAAAFLGVGALGQIITWVGGPSRALLQTAENGEISAMVCGEQTGPVHRK